MKIWNQCTQCLTCVDFCLLLTLDISNASTCFASIFSIPYPLKTWFSEEFRRYRNKIFARNWLITWLLFFLVTFHRMYPTSPTLPPGKRKIYGFWGARFQKLNPWHKTIMALFSHRTIKCSLGKKAYSKCCIIVYLSGCSVLAEEWCVVLLDCLFDIVPVL